MAAKKEINLSSKIKGWGADLAPENRPGVPKERTPKNGTGAHWTQPPQQEPHVKINVTIERPGITPVFGTSSPPRGISGLMRNFGYRYGESHMTRWLTLLAADRVDMVEGIILDFFKFRIPHPLREMGLVGPLHKDFENQNSKAKGAFIAGAGVAAILAAAFAARRPETKTYFKNLKLRGERAVQPYLQ